MAFKKLAMITQEADGWQVPDWRRLQADLVTGVGELCERLSLRPDQIPGGADDDSIYSNGAVAAYERVSGEARHRTYAFCCYCVTLEAKIPMSWRQSLRPCHCIITARGSRGKKLMKNTLSKHCASSMFM